MSFCSAVFAYGISSMFRISAIHIFVFFAMLFVYNGQRLYKIQFTQLISETPRIVWMKDHLNVIKALIAIGFIGTLIYGIPLLFYSVYSFALIAISLAVSVLYVLRIGKRNLREVPGMKVFFVTLVFFIITCFLPFQSFENLTLRLQDQAGWWMLFFLLQYLFVLGVTILFDIPDIKHDAKGMKTVAQMLGAQKTIVLSILLVFPFYILILFIGKGGTAGWILLGLHAIFYYFLIKRKSSSLYLSFFGDLILLLNGLFYLIAPYI